jgi:xanthine dehydrogenase accessory factor
MQKELELWQFVAKYLQLNQVVNLLVVAESSGSSPGRQGFKMAIAGDEMVGSIGGGVMEVSLVELAKLKSKKAKGKIVEQIHTKNSPNSSGMICSGRQTIIFRELTFDDLAAVLRIIDFLEKGEYAFFELSEKSLQASDSTKINHSYYFQKLNEDSFIYQEKLGYKNKLFIIGGGHCALALSELMSKLDFYITVFDDRPNLNTLQKNEFAHDVKIIESYEKIGELIQSDTNTYVVVMTLGYKFDEIVIRQLFDKDFKYLGVLGSKAKMKTLLKTLENNGFDKERLAKIHTPIGLPINSQTPEEIAVSIVAEIIFIKNRS